MGCVIPTPEFTSTLRELCDRHGTVLIMDEVMTGFRVALNGAQSLLNVKPDLTTMGKILGGGMPVGAYGGRADIMDSISPVGSVYQAGTLSGNPVAMASGLATLRQLQHDNPYPQLESLGQELAEGLAQLAEASGIPVQINRVGSMLTMFFTDQPVTDLTSAMTSDTARFAKYFHGMLDRGIYLPCSQFEALFISAAHTEQLIEETLVAAREVFSTLV
ncbi:MAG: aminotransferase class III-fold pyridoxal phosphate-dependent enzyme [Planctomycetaceae bacterium]